MDNRFRYAESEFNRLRGLLLAGQMTPQQFDAALQGLMIQDSNGYYWMINRNTGRWQVSNGQTWVEANPYGSAPSVAAQRPPAKRSKAGIGCGKVFVFGCLAVVVLVAIAGVGGYVAYSNGWITVNTFLNLVGLGPADIEVDNFCDGPVYVSILQLDVAQDSYPAQAALSLEAFDVRSYRAQDPGRYRVDFGTTDGGADLGTCTLTLKSGDQYQFVTLPDKIVINRVNHPVSVGSDLIVATSSLCR